MHCNKKYNGVCHNPSDERSPDIISYAPEPTQEKSITLVRALQKQVESRPDRMFTIVPNLRKYPEKSILGGYAKDGSY